MGAIKIQKHDFNAIQRHSFSIPDPLTQTPGLITNISGNILNNSITGPNMDPTIFAYKVQFRPKECRVPVVYVIFYMNMKLCKTFCQV